MTAVGLIFSNIHDKNLSELTRRRTMASIPYGCRYRLIDFALSNMVNSNITKVGIVTHYNYQSLLDHIGTGKDWDLARRSGGIKILPPFITAYENTASAKLYQTRLEALMGVTSFINRCTEDYIVMSDCDVICNMDLSAVIAEHERSDADITIVTKRIDASEFKLSNDVMIAVSADDGRDGSARLTEFYEYTPDVKGDIDISTNIMVVTRTYLQSILAEAIARGYHSFHRDIIMENLASANYRTYAYDGCYALIRSLNDYYVCSMNLLDTDIRMSLFGIRTRPVYTKVRNSPPTVYAPTAGVTNSLIADGCIIEGKVENSIIARGVRIGRGTVVRNSILFQDCYVGTDVTLNCVLADKGVVIKNGRTLSGHETLPFFIEKGGIV